MTDEREQWFLDRIGKRVFRNNYCDCAVCKNVYENGLILGDKYHALYCYDHERDFTADGHPLKYFDTKEEVFAFEKTIPNEV